jgi:hypothetical protein
MECHNETCAPGVTFSSLGDWYEIRLFSGKSCPFLQFHNFCSFFFPPEFQNALKIFSKVKSGRVATTDVAAVLESMDISVNPEMIKDVIQHAYEDSELSDFFKSVLPHTISLHVFFSPLTLPFATGTAY